MTESSDKLLKQVNDAKLLSATEHIIMPIIDKNIYDSIKIMCSKFRAGETNLLADIARLSYMLELVDTFESMKRRGESASNKLNNNKE